MKRWRIRYVKLGRFLWKLILLGGIVIRILLLPIDSTIVEAASPIWTVTSEYGSIDSAHPTPHKGVDFAVPQGTPLKSVVEGTVEVVKDEGNVSYGKSVRIRTDDGRLVIYGHLSDMAVRVGEHVDFGEVIGKSGNTGGSTGPHLHFEVKINGKSIDPNPTLWEGTMKKALSGGD
jgi:murein DD-endopeptidase MepM/ murein hydrolase activator NlpD